MAEQYSLQLQLEGYDKFMDQAGKIDSKIDEVSKSLEGLANKFNSLDFGKISFDTKALETLIGLDIKGKGTSLASLVKAYAGLGAEIKAIDADKLTAVNKALSGGATAKTIEAKALAFGNLASEIGKVSRLKNLDGVPNALKQIFDALSASTSFDADKIKLIGPAITKLVKSLDSLNELKFSQDTIKYLERLTESLTLLGAGNNITMLKDLIPVIKAISTSFKSFGVSTKTFDAKTLSSNLNAAGTALLKFLEVSKQFGGGLFNKTFENFKAMATAVKELGKAFVEFKTPTSSFGDIEKNISSTIRALENLKGEFAKFSGTTSKSVKDAAESFKAIGDAASSLGARSKSFEKLPDNIAKLNQALNSLDINRLKQLEPTLRSIGPALQSMANLASVAGRSFLGMGSNANKAVEDTSAFQKFKAIISSIPNAVSGTIAIFQKLVPVLSTVTSALLKMPLDFVKGAFKVLATAIAAPYNILKFFGELALKVNRELRILEIGLNVLLSPFKLLQGLLTTLGNAFNTFIGIIQKAFSVFDKFGVSLGKTKNEFTNFGSSTDTAKGKATALGSTLDTLDDKAIPVGNAFKQMGSDVRNSIDDSTTGRFIQFSTSLQAITTVGTAVYHVLRQMSQAFQTFFTNGYEAAASMEDVTKSLNTLNAADLMRQQTDGSLQLKDAIAQTVGVTQELLDRYQRFAFQSPFSREQLTNAHQLAQSLGFTAAEAEELVLRTADWATANGLSGDAIKSLILPLGQINTLTKANTVDMKQLITAGNVPAFELLRQELERLTGTQMEMSEVQELLSAGMISSDVAINAVLNGFKQFEGVAANSVGTLSGLKNAFGDMKDNLIRGFVEPILSSDEGLRDLFATILSAENIFAGIEVATNLGKQFAAVVVPAVKGIINAITIMNATWAAIPEPIKQTIFFALKFVAITATITAGIFVVTAAISGLVSGFALFVGAVPLASAAVAGFAAALILNFTAMRNAIADILWSFSELPQIIIAVGKALQSIFNTGTFDIRAFSGLSSLSMSIAGGLTTGLTAIGSALASTWNAISEWAGQFGDLAVTLYGYGVDTILAFADGVWNGAGALVNAFKGITDIFTLWFKPNSPPKVAPDIDLYGVETIAVWVGGLVQGAQQYLPSFGDTIKPILEKTLQIFGAIGLFSFNVLISSLIALGNVISGVFTILVSVGAAVVSEVALAISTAVKIIQTLFDPVLTFKEKFIGVLNQIGFFVTGTFVNIGLVVTGTISGITTILLSFVDFLSGVFLSALISISYAFPQTFGNIYADLVTFTQESTAAITDFVNNSTNSFVDLLVSMVDYGYGLISAFSDGIYAAVDTVASALSALGDLISYWLAPGSPPRLLPDIDEWGTAAAQEFLDGFNEADINVINDFGKTIGDTLDKLNVEGINVEEVTRAFATGLDNLKRDGDFGADVMQRIVDLTATAGPEVASLTSKYKMLAEEQVKLNDTTSAYNEELQKAQGTLDTINANEEIGDNQKRLVSLNNALQNTYLTTEERTKIQTQIDKLQATNKVKQLQQQVKAQETNVDSVTKSIDLQKKLLDVSDAFDGTKSANAAKTASDAAAKASDAAAKKAEAAAKRMTELQLKQELAGKTTEEQISIYKEYLSTLEAGSEEYVKTQTKIIELEARLIKERETSVKKLGKEAALAEKFGEALGGAGSPFSGVADEIKKKTEQVTGSFQAMVAKVQQTWDTFKTFFTVGETAGFLGSFDFSTVNKAAITLGVTFGAISRQIKIATGYFDKYVIKNDLVRNALISLATVLVTGGIALKIKGIALALGTLISPLSLTVGAIALLVSGIYTFVQSSGGLEATLTRLQGAWTRFTAAFGAGKFATDFKMDFSSIEGIATTLGLLLGKAFFNLNDNIKLFFQNIGKSITDNVAKLDLTGLTSIKDFFSKNWIEIITGLGATLLGIFSGSWFLILKGLALVIKNFTLPTDLFAQLLLDIVWNFNTYLTTPLIAAFTDNDTVLGKIAAAIKVFYSGIGTILGAGISTIFSNLGSGGFAKEVENFFATSGIGKSIESNVNEAVGVFAPSLKGKFDFSDFTATVLTQFNTVINTVKGFGVSIYQIFTQGPLANAFVSVKDAFADFFATITSSPFLAAVGTISKTIGLIVVGFVGLVAALTSAGLIGILKNVADLFIVVADGINTVYTGIQQIISGNIFGGLITIFGGILNTINNVFDVIGQTVADAILAMVGFFSPTWAKRLEPVVSMISKLIVGFFGWNGVMTKVFALFGKLFGPLINFFTRTTTAVGATGAKLTAFQRIMEPFSIVLKNVGNAFKAAWEATLRFGENIPGLSSLLKALGNLFNVIMQPIRFVIDLLKQLFVYLFPAKVNAGPSFFSQVFDALVAGFNKLVSYIPTVVSTLQNVWRVITEIASAVFYVSSKIVEFISLLAQLAFNIIKAVVTSNLFTGVLRWIIDLVKALWSVFTLILKVIFKFGEYIFNIGKAFFTALRPVETFLAFLRTLKVIAEIIGVAISRVAGIVTAFGATIYNAFNNGIQSLLQIDFVADFVAWASGWVDAIWTGLATFVVNIPTKIMEWTKAFAEWLEPHSPPKFLPDLMEWGRKIALVFLQAIINGPLTMLADWGMRIGNAIVNFDWLQFAGDLGQALTGLVSASISKVVKVGVAVSDFIFVNPDEQMKLAEEIYSAIPNVDAIFGEDSTKKIALNLADIVTINPVELETATGYFQEFGASLRSLVNIDAIPEVFTNSLQAVKNFFSGDASFLETVKTVVLELGKLINLEAIPEIFTNGLNSIISLFAENQTVATVASSILDTLESFALLLGVPQGTIDNIENFFSKFTNVEVVLDAIYTAFERLVNIDLSGISKVFEPLTNIFDSVQAQIDKIKEGLSFIPGINLTGADVEGTDNVKDSVQESLNKAVNDTSIDVKTRINTITDSTNLSEQSANVLTAFNDAMATNAGALDDNLTETVNTYIAAGFNAEDIKKLATEAGVEVPAGIEAAFANPENWAGANTEAGTQLVSLFTSIKENLGIQSPSTEARDQIGIPIVQGIAEGLGDTEGIDFTTPVANIFTSIIAAAQEQLTIIGEKVNVVAALFTLDEAIVAKTTESLALTVELFTTSFETITTLITETLDLYLELFDEFYTVMLEMMDEFVTSFLTKFDELTGQVSEKIKTLIATIKAFAPAFTEAGTSLAKAFVNGFKNYIAEDGPGRNQIESAINSLASFISNSNETLNESFTNAGKSFGKPFVEGVAAGIDASRDSARLKSAVVALVNRIIEEARTAAGIASPSKLAAAQVGLPIVEGIGVGIESGITFVTDGIDSLVNAISLRNTQIGQSFTAGVADGIGSSTSLVTNAVRALADESITAARTALDINSPSKVTNRLIGLPFVQGIATALESGKGMLKPLTSDLLSVLPKSANFDFGINQDMRLKEQSIDVKYNGLLNSLPMLSQNVNLNRSLVTSAALKIAPSMANMQRERMASYTQMLMIPHQLQKQQALANTSYMHNNRSTVVNNNNEYHMHLTTSESSASRRVERNFNAMRFGYRFR